jgi:hypothetical protein
LLRRCSTAIEKAWGKTEEQGRSDSMMSSTFKLQDGGGGELEIRQPGGDQIRFSEGKRKREYVGIYGGISWQRGKNLSRLGDFSGQFFGSGSYAYVI